ncbi:MAG: proline-rich domain-containing protein [Bdellovibrionota bacterium]
MKNHFLVLKCLPVLVLALSVGCAKKEEAKKAADGQPAISIPGVDLGFEAECDGGTSVASTARADLPGCNLTQSQMSALQNEGRFKVEADCVKQTVRIRNASGQVLGSESYDKQSGAFSVPLAIGAQVNQLDGCPVAMAATASGVVTCSADNKPSTTVSVEFDLAQDAAALPAAFAAAVGDANQSGQQKAPLETGKQELGKTGTQEGNKGNQDGKSPVVPQEGNKGNQDGKSPVVAQEGNKGNQDGKSPIVGKQEGNQEGKAPVVGKQEGNKGNQELDKTKGGQEHGPVPGSNIGACSVNACKFSASTSLSCSQ